MAKKLAKKCFIISPIGSPDSPERIHSDLVCKHIIIPATEKCGYKAERSDKYPDPTMIPTKVIQHLIEDDLIIAVLSGNNANVFYELAIRHAKMLPCIHLLEVGSEVPFDITGMHMIRYNLKNWDSPQECIKDLEEAIKITEKRENAVNPISTALAIHESIISEDVKFKNFGIMYQQLQQLSSDLRRLISSAQYQYNQSFFSSADNNSHVLGSLQYTPYHGGAGGGGSVSDLSGTVPSGSGYGGSNLSDFFAPSSSSRSRLKK